MYLTPGIKKSSSYYSYGLIGYADLLFRTVNIKPQKV